MHSLNPEQQQAFDAALAGYNMFVTGGAGTGKSAILAPQDATYRRDRQASELGVSNVHTTSQLFTRQRTF